MPETDVLSFVITIIATLIALIAPIPLPQEQRLVVIATIILIFLAVILSNFNKRIDKQEEKLNIYNQLIDIKAELKNLSKYKK